MDAAMTVMKREGIAAASTRAICQEAGMAHGVFHYCFRSKRELFAALTEADFNAPLEDAWGKLGPTTDPEDGFRDLFAEYWSSSEKDAGHQLVLLELTNYALRDEELRGLPQWEHSAYRDKIAHHLQQFQAQLGVEFTIPADELAELILAALSGVTTAWLAHGDGKIARRSLDQFAAVFASYAKSSQ